MASKEDFAKYVYRFLSIPDISVALTVWALSITLCAEYFCALD